MDRVSGCLSCDRNELTDRLVPVFELLGGPADEWVSDDEADRVSGEIRRELGDG